MNNPLSLRSALASSLLAFALVLAMGCSHEVKQDLPAGQTTKISKLHNINQKIGVTPGTATAGAPAPKGP